jgi:hypothetical protein
MNTTSLNAVDGRIFQGREQRDALIDPEANAALQTMEREMRQPGWAAMQADKQAGALWLSSRLSRPSAEVLENFDTYSRHYFGRVITPGAVYDEIVKYEADQMALLSPQPAAASTQTGEEGGGQGEEAAPAPKFGQFIRTAGGAFEKAGQDTAAGTFSIIEGALNSMGGTPEREGVSEDEGYLDAVQTLDRLERSRLGDTEEARRLRAVVQVKATELDRDFAARKADYEGSVRGALASTAREHADFFYELGGESMDRYGSDPAYRETFVGKAAAMSGQMVATSALMAGASLATAARVGKLGSMVIRTSVPVVGTGQIYAGVSGERREFMGDEYRNEGWNFVQDLTDAGVQQAIEMVPFLDNALEAAVKLAPIRGGTVSLGQVLRRFPAQAARSGGVEAAEEVLQGAWHDFIVDQGYDDERVDMRDGKLDYLKRRSAEAFAGFAGGVMMAGAVQPVIAVDQNRAARRAQKLLTAKDGGLFSERDFQLLREAKDDEQIRGMMMGEVLLAAANGDRKAMRAYNVEAAKQAFRQVDGLAVADGKLGEIDGQAAFLKDDGEAVMFDMTKAAQASAWERLKERAAVWSDMQAMRGAEGEVATMEMVDYVRGLQTERGGVTTIETKAQIPSLVAEFGAEKAQALVDQYVAAGLLPVGITVGMVAPEGASDTRFDEKARKFVTSIRIAQGASPLVVLEESAHDYFKRQIELGEFTEATVDGWRTAVEAGWSGKMEFNEMHEWLAKYAVGYATGKAQASEVSRLPASFKRFLERFAKFVRESLEFAAQVMQMERDNVLPADFLRALQEATGTVDAREDGAMQEPPLMSELDREEAEAAMKADGFPKIEGNEADGWTVTAPDGEQVASALTVEDAQDRAMDWWFTQEQDAEREAAKKDAGERKGDELMTVVRRLGGLRAASREDVLAGELRGIAENMGVGDRLRTFRKKGMDLDRLREALGEQGFDYGTPAEMLDAMERSTRGTPVYARGAGGETFSLSRAVPADASNVVEMPDGARLVGPTTFSITAYHGTPHKVDKFTTAKIGTGEGAQAYGWGLYFAESKAVAEAYREALSPGRGIGAADIAARVLTASGDDYTKAIADLKRRVESLEERRIKDPESVPKDSRTPGTRTTLHDALDLLIKQSPVAGHVYTVELLPAAEEFLDWDAPLSKQSDKVKAVLAEAIDYIVEETHKSFGEAHEQGWGSLKDEPFTQATREEIMDAQTGMDAYNAAKKLARKGKRYPIEESDELASKALARAGIPGIRFLDAGSRNAGEGTRNYVLFDEALVKIIAENGKPVGGGSGAGTTFSLQSKLFSESNRLDSMDRNGATWKRIVAENPSLKDDPQTVVGYRAAIGTELRPDDFIALNRAVAVDHLENLKDRGERGTVTAHRVKVGDLLMGNDATEFVWFPRGGGATMSLAPAGPARPTMRREDPMLAAIREDVDRIFEEQKLRHWQALGLADVANMQAETYVDRVNAALEAEKLVREGGIVDALGRKTMTIVSELNRFAPGLGTILQRTTAENMQATARDKRVVVALGDKIKALPKDQANAVFLQFHVLSRKGDGEALHKLARVHGFEAELDAAEAMLTQTRRDTIEAGEPWGRFWSQPEGFTQTEAFTAQIEAARKAGKGRVGEAVERVLLGAGFKLNIEFYWPSRVFDREGLREYLGVLPVESDMGKALRELEERAMAAGRPVTDEELTSVMGAVRDGMMGRQRGASLPGSLKARTVAAENINIESIQFYYGPIEAALMHVESMRKHIQQREFFGNSIIIDAKEDTGRGTSPIDLAGSGAALVAKLGLEGKMDRSVQARVSELVQARFKPTPASRVVSVIRALGNVTGLGQIYSGFTASVDALGIGLREDGVNPLGTFIGIIRAATGKNEVTLEQLGLDMRDIGDAYMTANKWETKLVNWVFKYNGLAYMSRFFAQAGLNQALAAAQKQARRGEMDWRKQKRLDRLFGDRAGQVMQDLAAGRDTPETRFYAFATIADYQPVSQDQATHWMLTSNYGKVFAQFKSFLAVQFTGMREDAFNEIKSGDSTRALAGMRHLLALAATLLMFGLPADMLRALLTGRSFILSDQVAARLLGMIGISPYLVREGQRGGPSKLAASVMVPAVGGIGDDLWKDVQDYRAALATGADTSLLQHIAKSRFLQNTPFIGRIYGERLGVHAERNAESREEVGWFVLTGPDEDLGKEARRDEATRRRLEEKYGSGE